MAINFLIDDSQLMTGVNIPVEGLGITIRQPNLKEISILGEQNYLIALRIFGMSSKDITFNRPDAENEISNWMIFQEALKQKIEGIANTRQFCTNFLQLFFNRTVQIGPNSIMLIGEDDQIANIEKEDFEYLQEIIKTVGGGSLLSPPQEEFRPKNKKAAEIAAKMKKARERLNKVKALESGSIKKGQSSFIKRYMKIVTIGTSNSLEDVKKMTLFQLCEIAQSYLAKEAYDLEISSRLAGAKNDKPLVHWIMKEDEEDSGIGTI